MEPPPMDVLCCGLATLDLIQYVDVIPGPDEKVVSSDAILDAGGPAANAARTAAALGARTMLVTILGATDIAETVVGLLLEDGIEIVDPHPETLDWRPPIAAITVDAEGRRSVVSAVSSGAPAVAQAPPTTPAARVVLVDGHHLDLALTVARTQRDAGAVVVLDGGSWKPGLEQLLPLVDVAVLSADFRYPAEHAAALERVPYVAVTSGAGPIRLRSQRALDQGGRAHAEEADDVEIAVPTVAAVDTLGAGDVLHGALCHELARRPGLDLGGLSEALTRAADVASRSCEYRGALTWARQRSSSQS